MIKVLCKVVNSVIDTLIKTVLTFHDVIYGFCASRGTGMAIMEPKMVQELASIDQDPLFLAFLDLRKAYNTLEHGRLLQNVEGYGAGPNMRSLLE